DRNLRNLSWILSEGLSAADEHGITQQTRRRDMNVKKWIAYGATGAVGLGVIAGGAAAAASTMDLRTQDGAVVPGGAITERASVLDGKKVQLRQTDSAVTVVSAPSPRSVASGPSAVSRPS